MTGLLEIREKLKLIYSKNEVFILPIAKFLLAFVTLTIINGRFGFMSSIDKLPIVLISALFCSFLPTGFIVFFAAVFSLLHMYALSMEVALVGLCLYLIMFLVFFRFSPKDSLAVILTPLLFAVNIPYVMPIAMGLLGTPASVVSVGCGVVIYYFLSYVITSATAISSMEAGEVTAKLRLLIDGILDNNEMIVIIVAFAVTIIVVYLIRRMSVDFAWSIAMAAGAIINLVLLLVGDLIFNTNMSVAGAILGTLIALVAAKVLEFFRFCVDYSRTEKVQFEDDEYYYYVKAVPKMTVAAQTKTVKKINTQRRSVPSKGSNSGRSAAVSGRSSSASHTVGSRGSYHTSAAYEEDDFISDNNRSVVTERTSYSRNTTRSATSAVRRNNGQQGFTINSKMAEDAVADNDLEFDYDFEELE